jgi:ABC-type multidrug transport system fused ATPase/permease subunit
MVDSYSGKSSFNFSAPIFTIALLFVITLSTVFGYYTFVLMQELGSRLRNDIRVDFYANILNRPFSFFKSEQVGELTSHASEDIGKLQSFFSNFVVTLYQNFLFIIGCIALMLLLNWFAAMVVLALIILPLPVILFYSKKIRRLASASQEEHAKANAIMEESLIGIREVKSFLIENLKLNKYTFHEDEALEKEKAAARYQSKSSQIVYLILSAILVAIFYFSSSGIVFATAGDAVAFFFYAFSLTMSFLSLGRAYSSYQSISGSTSKIIEILGSGHTSSLMNKKQISDIKGKVEFENVSFAYEKGRNVFDNLSFILNEGKWLLITGPSGIGKSTIANLLLGLYSPLNGKILIDSVPLDEFDERLLRKNIGYVPQEPILFNGTVKENILLSKNDIPDKRLEKAIKICILDEFISLLPKGIETNISERGISLSAGQKSRVAIARAIVYDPAILILDEANSMLEGPLEKNLWQNLLNDRKNKTTIILSHHTANIPNMYEHFELKATVNENSG